MACTITLPFWPSALDCIDWSLDNLLAVVGGEHVAVLIPRLQASQPPFWDTVIIQVNAFTLAELPLQEHLPDLDFSIGEEIAIRQAEAAKWSPPGLARFGGCALAVHTSNHILSVWAPQGRPSAAPNWKRSLIINYAVREYYDRRVEHQSDSIEQAQIRHRIFAFIWSPALYFGIERQNDHLFHGSHFLAAATGANDILLLRLESPCSGDHGQSSDWKVTITDCVKVGARVDHIAWSPWRAVQTSGDSSLATIVYIAGGKLFSVPVVGTPEAAVKAVQDPMQLLARSDVVGPIRFEQNAIIVFGPDTVHRLEPRQPSVSHHLDGRWDAIAGSVITKGTLHVVSQMSTANAATSSLQFSEQSRTFQRQDDPEWKMAILEQKTAYGGERDLIGHVQERTWGIASSPVDGFIATCVSMHPADAIAYVISSNQLSVLSISSDGAGPDTPLPSMRVPVPMDVQYFYLRHVSTSDRKAVCERVRETVQSEITASTVEYLLRRLRVLLYSTDVRRMHLNTIVALLEGKSTHTVDSIRIVIRHLTSSFLNFPTVGLQFDKMSLDISRVYDVALSKVAPEHKLGDLVSGLPDIP